jgi:RNA polymerase sigma-70 factor (ECF subfamily)
MPTPGAEVRQLPETQWSRLVELADRGDRRFAERLQLLLERYWLPVYYYVRTLRRVTPEEAEDLTQGFFASLLERLDFGALSPARGSFRGFLKTAVRNHLVSQDRKEAARGGGKPAVALDVAEAERAWPELLSAELSPEAAFDRAFANAVLAEAHAKLRDELAAHGKALHYRVFEEYCLHPDEGQSYESVAARHGVKAGDVRNYLHFVRQRARELLRETVREHLAPGESVDDEVKYLLSH